MGIFLAGGFRWARRSLGCLGMHTDDDSKILKTLFKVLYFPVFIICLIGIGLYHTQHTFPTKRGGYGWAWFWEVMGWGLGEYFTEDLW